MPFIIAFILYVILTGLVLAVVGGICWARQIPSSRWLLSGVVGSAGGFLLGCVVGTLACFAGLPIAAQFGATAIISVASLGSALLGTVVGVATARRSA